MTKYFHLGVQGIAIAVACLFAAQAQAALRTFTFDLNPANWEVRAGVTVPIWGFSDTVNPRSIPGPLLRVDEGDIVQLTFRNTHIKPHTIHLHGYHPVEVDGVIPVPPGENFVYEFIADPAGTYVYHCHVNTPVHQDRGMYGQFIVDTAREPRVDREFLLVLDEHPRIWEDLGTDADQATHEYIINGKAFDANAPGKNLQNSRMTVRTGQTVRLRVSNFGFVQHPMALEGHTLNMLQGSDPLGTPTPMSSAELVTNHSLNLAFTAGAPGTYRFYSQTPGETGMQTELVVTP